MSQFLSFFVHDDAETLPIGKRYLFGDLRSHLATMKLHGLRYGKPDCWREAEWTGVYPRTLDVRGRNREHSLRLKAVVLADFPTRNDLLKSAALKLPDGLTTLDLSAAKVPAALKLPDGLTTLYLRGAKGRVALKLPDGCRVAS